MRVMIALFVIAAVLSGVHAKTQDVTDEINMQRDFATWMEKYEKQYDTMELFYRYDIYKQNRAKIDEHNSGDHSYKLGENQFMDLSQDEFAENYLSGVIKPGTTSLLGAAQQCEQGSFAAATSQSIDWSSKNVVTKVKNQGQCGSCWAFSTTGSIESHIAIKAGVPPESLSEQQLVDCSAKYGNNGCQGGLMDYGFQYVIQNGLCSEDSYPYEARKGICKQSCKAVAHIQGCKDVPKDDLSALKGALEQTGPVSVAIEADQLAFQLYHSGILQGNCGDKLDHGVLLVGFDDTGSTPFFKVKNSWGETWGEEGYVRIAQENDKCGIQLSASIPVV